VGRAGTIVLAGGQFEVSAQRKNKMEVRKKIKERP
jgi:hypothetical protein